MVVDLPNVELVGWTEFYILDEDLCSTAKLQRHSYHGDDSPGLQPSFDPLFPRPQKGGGPTGPVEFYGGGDYPVRVYQLYLENTS